MAETPIPTRDVRLTDEQLDVLRFAARAHRRDLERRLERYSYDGKPRMKDAVLADLATLRELDDILEHNLAALRREKAERIRAALGLS